MEELASFFLESKEITPMVFWFSFSKRKKMRIT